MDYTSYFEQKGWGFQDADLFFPHPNPTYGKPAFDANALKVLIVRLSPFRDVERSLPHLFLASEVRRAISQSYIDFAFFPTEKDRKTLIQDKIPLLTGIQSHRTSDEFDLVLVSNAFLLEIINLPYLFLNSGIPLFSRERDEKWPAFILGGSNAIACQSIVNEQTQSLVDAIFFGEAEEMLEPLLHVANNRRSLVQDKDGSFAPKRTMLQEMAQKVDGLWVCGTATQKLVKAIVQEPKADRLPTAYPILNSQQAGTARLQISFGCPSFCSFCLEGYDRKPYREIPWQDLVEKAKEIKRVQGTDTLEVYSFNFNTHQDIYALLIEFHKLFDKVSFKSQRADLLEATYMLLESEVAADKRSFTLGIEGISERMIAFLHKSLETSAIEKILPKMLQQKIREIKLFYILTGYERSEDQEEFRRFVERLAKWHKQYNRGIRILFSFGLLVRMPRTPLQYDRLFLNENTHVASIKLVQQTCENAGFEFRLASGWTDYFVTQVLALGGYMAETIVDLAKEGYCYETELPREYERKLRAKLQSRGFWNEEFLLEKDESYRFAFDFVQSGIQNRFLYKMFQDARNRYDGGYCLQQGPKEGQCLACGACATQAQKKAILQHKIVVPTIQQGFRKLEATVSAKNRLQPVYAKFRLGYNLAGWKPEWLNNYAMRSLLQAYPELVENLLSVQESLFTTNCNREKFPPFYGETVFALKAWNRETLLHALANHPTKGKSLPFSLEFLSICENFEPGSFREMDIHLVLPSVYFPDAGKTLLAALQDFHHVPCNIRKDGENCSFVIPQQAKKKKFLLEGSYGEADAEFHAFLKVGCKFTLERFFHAFGCRGIERNARMAVSQVIF